VTEKPSANHPLVCRQSVASEPTGAFGAVQPDSPKRPLVVGVWYEPANGSMNAGSCSTRVP
jgi:hypothetical protein